MTPLPEARSQFLRIGQVLDLAQCSRSLGGILRMQFKYPKASETLTESRGQFFKIDHVLDPAECSESLNGIVC